MAHTTRQGGWEGEVGGGGRHTTQLSGSHVRTCGKDKGPDSADLQSVRTRGQAAMPSPMSPRCHPRGPHSDRAGPGGRRQYPPASQQLLQLLFASCPAVTKPHHSPVIDITVPAHLCPAILHH
jgi:hypothetical protein